MICKNQHHPAPHQSCGQVAFRQSLDIGPTNEHLHLCLLHLLLLVVGCHLHTTKFSGWMGSETAHHVLGYIFHTTHPHMWQKIFRTAVIFGLISMLSFLGGWGREEDSCLGAVEHIVQLIINIIVVNGRTTTTKIWFCNTKLPK